MSNFSIIRTKNTVSASAHMPYGAYKHALGMATDRKAEIGKTEEGFFKATFSSAKVATDFVKKFNADYTEAHNAYVTAHADAPKATSARKPKADTPKKAKGNGIDFNAFKGTKSEKNRALHAMLVSMGIKDSRTPEYQAVWNARPWAK